MFSVEIMLALACTRGHVHNIPFESSALTGRFLNSWCVTFRKHLIQSMITCSILSFPPYYVLLVHWCHIHVYVPVYMYMYMAGHLQVAKVGGTEFNPAATLAHVHAHVHAHVRGDER